jgi:NAD(P)-dependent dehydrogenase (short-subunit alcohol dehydrogenase family)
VSRLDVAFNNAGIQVPPTDAADWTAAAFGRCLRGNAVNLRGVWAAMRHEPRQMRAAAVCPGLIDPPASPSTRAALLVVPRGGRGHGSSGPI